ncbi:MAG: SDR family oxidoreductase [Cyanobacteria bacterium J06598_1]
MAKHALITGGSQGAGKATALLFAKNGWDITVAARGEERLNTAAEQIRSTGQQALAVPTDISDAAQVAELVERSTTTFGSIDALINNAGICLTGPMNNTSLEDWKQILGTNLWGCIHTIQAVLPAMLEQEDGVIINVGSIGGKMPLPEMTAYCTSKYALTGLTESLRLELSAKGIHVGIVHPGIINSDFMERAMFRGKSSDEAAQRQQQMMKTLESGIASKPEDVAKAVWKAVTQRQNEGVVGPATVATAMNRFFPELTQWALKQGVS